MTTVLSVAEAQKSFGETKAFDGAELELFGHRLDGTPAGGMTAAFLIIARILARRWETV